MAKKNNAPAKPKLPPEEALYQAVSLCRKAGALTMGFDAVEGEVYAFSSLFTFPTILLLVFQLR